ncbi:MAG: hypothetical protein Q8Q89_02030 [bacterium]|nr:hypothetical protein [bacterium]
MKWEKVGQDSELRISTYRYKILGGWLVVSRSLGYYSTITQSFVPDPQHEWKLEENK